MLSSSITTLLLVAAAEIVSAVLFGFLLKQFESWYFINLTSPLGAGWSATSGWGEGRKTSSTLPMIVEQPAQGRGDHISRALVAAEEEEEAADEADDEADQAPAPAAAASLVIFASIFLTDLLSFHACACSVERSSMCTRKAIFSRRVFPLATLISIPANWAK